MVVEDDDGVLQGAHLTELINKHQFGARQGAHVTSIMSAGMRCVDRAMFGGLLIEPRGVFECGRWPLISVVDRMGQGHGKVPCPARMCRSVEAGMRILCRLRLYVGTLAHLARFARDFVQHHAPHWNRRVNVRMWLCGCPCGCLEDARSSVLKSAGERWLSSRIDAIVGR